MCWKENNVLSGVPTMSGAGVALFIVYNSSAVGEEVMSLMTETFNKGVLLKPYGDYIWWTRGKDKMGAFMWSALEKKYCFKENQLFSCELSYFCTMIWELWVFACIVND